MNWTRAIQASASAILALVCLLAGCAVPARVSVYDDDCGKVFREYVLEYKDNEIFDACGKSTTVTCTTALLSAGVVYVASSVISGSIVLIGNTLQWTEKKLNCPKKQGS